MLSRLSIRNIVLAKALDLEFYPGLCVLTGETGAGKSVLLDSLNLALGKRAESRLVRAGEEEAEVSVEFELPVNHPIYQQLKDLELAETGENLIFRRKLTNDGRSKAWLNNRPVSLNILKSIGNELLEFHGQFDTQKLLDAATHKSYLDKYGQNETLLAHVKEAWQGWGKAQKKYNDALERLKTQQNDADFIRHATQELENLDPQVGEETQLSEQRHIMKLSHELVSSLNQSAEYIEGENGILMLIRQTQRRLEQANEKTDGKLEKLIQLLEDIALKSDDALYELQEQQRNFDFSAYDLEKLEDRLFALRGAARKYNVTSDELAEKLDEFRQNLNLIDNSADSLKALEKELKQAKEQYITASDTLSDARQKAAQKLDKALNAELTPLHLSKASFHTLIEPLSEPNWNSEGKEYIEFQVSTHKGAAPGPIGKIASGGELARFTLALRIVLAKVDGIMTLVLDEADAGISGRIADAMGQRLSLLANDIQLLVITHSPQVAARGWHHWQVSKFEDKSGIYSQVVQLDGIARSEAIAAMLAGKEITDEARAAADKLLNS
ncbi:MAG: DNA repair protein RecN [Alphaproteobacteria bacterium]